MVGGDQDFRGCGISDRLSVCREVIEYPFEMLDPVRLADLVGMQGHTHYRAAVFAFGIETIERVFYHSAVAAWFDLVDHVSDRVIELQRVRHRHEALAATRVHRGRLVVVEQVAGVGATGFGEQVDCAFRVRQRRRQVAVTVLAGMPLDQRHRLLDHLALLRFVQSVGVARVVDAVAEELVVARGVTEHVRQRAWPRLALRVGRRRVLVELDVGGDPQGDPRAVRPTDRRATVIWPVVVQAWIGPGSSAGGIVHGDTLRSSSSTFAMDSTSAYLSMMSQRFAKWGISCLSATHSSTTIGRKPRDRLSMAHARTQPEVEPPVMMTVSMR